MSKVWFTSDIHGYHKNIAGPNVSSWGSGYRDFEDEFYMTTHIVNEINRVVNEDDILYCLGDWAFGGIDNILKLRERLNVKTIHLIYGNHDDHIKKNKPIKTEDGFVNAQHLFTSVQDVLTVKLEGKEFFMSHYSHQVWAASHKGIKHLFGHSHGSLEGVGKSFDVGVDSAYKLLGEYRPFSLQEVLDILDKKEVKFVDHHNSRTNR